MTGWPSALDRYEAELDACEALLDEDGSDTAVTAPGWSRPPIVPAGGVPVEHRARAEALLVRTTALARRVTMVHEALPPLPAIRPRRAAAYPATVDASRVDRSM